MHRYYTTKHNLGGFLQNDVSAGDFLGGWQLLRYTKIHIAGCDVPISAHQKPPARWVVHGQRWACHARVFAVVHTASVCSEPSHACASTG